MAGKSRSWEKAKLLDEGAVQMWVYELLCTGDQRTRKKILGRHEKQIKVVIPEFQLPKTGKTKTGHNTDFRVVFKNFTSFADGKIEHLRNRVALEHHC